MWKAIESKLRLYKGELEWLKNIINKARKKSWIKRIFVFWSRLNKELSWWDIDLLVEFEENFKDKTLEKWRLRLLFQEFCDTNLDIVEYDKNNVFFKTIKNPLKIFSSQ